MSDPWISRLVVSGTATDVSAFQTAATRRDGDSATALSFVQLHALLDDDEGEGLGKPFDPWSDADDPVEPPDLTTIREDDQLLSCSYHFSLAEYEPDPLLIRVSRHFPRLCFVLGWVSNSNDEQASRFIRNGRIALYRLPAGRAESMRTRAYRNHGLSLDAADEIEIDDWNALLADFEADGTMLDAVVNHWDRKVVRTLGSNGGSSTRR